jgi:hypothetical protein
VQEVKKPHFVNGSRCPVEIEHVQLRDHVTGISRPLVTAGSVRRLLSQSEGLHLARRVVEGLTNEHVKRSLWAVLRGRLDRSPVSPFVSSLAFQLAGVGGVKEVRP